VPARAALAGNPSDGYGGAVLAVAFDDVCATAEARAVNSEPAHDNPLVRATVARFARHHAPAAHATAITWHTTIPRSCGLGGSSAIVLAVTSCLCELHDVSLSQAELAEFALAVETEDLGIAAGLQDRVAQAYGGVTFMDFAPQLPAYDPLPPGSLPPLVVAWRADAHEDSWVVHGDLRARFTAGEPVVREAMSELAEAARRARDAVKNRDHVELAASANASFDARRRMMPLDPRHVAMIETARAAGAGANYAGSGGSIVCVCRDERHQASVVDALRTARGCEALAPRIR
jgi:galactokinase/mevalonate kinase-like predicted kinase